MFVYSRPTIAFPFNSIQFPINTCLTSRSSIKLSTTSISVSIGIYRYHIVQLTAFYFIDQPRQLLKCDSSMYNNRKIHQYYVKQMRKFLESFKSDIFPLGCNYFNLTGITFIYIRHYMQVHTVSKYAFGMLLLKIGSLCDQFNHHEIIRYRWTFVMVRYIKCIT